jgi:hypothetical protein
MLDNYKLYLKIVKVKKNYITILVLIKTCKIYSKNINNYK